MQVFEMTCYRMPLKILYNDHVTNGEICRTIQATIGEYDHLMTLVKKQKLKWFGHVSRSSGLAKTVLQGKVKGIIKKVDRRRGGKTVIKNGFCLLKNCS